MWVRALEDLPVGIGTWPKGEAREVSLIHGTRMLAAGLVERADATPDESGEVPVKKSRRQKKADKAKDDAAKAAEDAAPDQYDTGVIKPEE